MKIHGDGRATIRTDLTVKKQIAIEGDRRSPSIFIVGFVDLTSNNRSEKSKFQHIAENVLKFVFSEVPYERVK